MHRTNDAEKITPFYAYTRSTELDVQLRDSTVSCSASLRWKNFMYSTALEKPGDLGKIIHQHIIALHDM
jgi:hypothetical protein